MIPYFVQIMQQIGLEMVYKITKDKLFSIK